ncbi:MAG: hypothetical protein Q8O88_03935 [bacterium]|nr:hypothetical protein [bacterium]
MKKLFSLLCLYAFTLMVSAQNSTAQENSDSYKPCDECFGYKNQSQTNEYSTNGYNSNTTTAERQYNQTCINGLNYENQYQYPYDRPRRELEHRILRIAIGLISFAVIVAILPYDNKPYIQ